MIASLGMYDMPHLRGAHDRLWTGIRAALGYGPAQLNRGGDPWREWLSPDLVLAQSCGLPYRAKLHGHVTLVGTPDYDLPDCPPGHYFSFIIRRKDDRRDLEILMEQGVMAFNDGLSQSGWAALLDHAAPAMPLRTRHTGSHAISIRSVLSGTADYAAIDALTYILWADVNPVDAASVDTFARTRPTPVLPYITARGRDPIPIARALGSAIANLSFEDRVALRIKGVVQLPIAAYLSLPIPPAP